MAASIFDLLNVPWELTLECLATFARFEVAECGRFCHRDGPKDAATAAEGRRVT